MYKNFNLTEQEKKQIMEQHASHGYKQPINEIGLLRAGAKRLAKAFTRSEVRPIVRDFAKVGSRDVEKAVLHDTGNSAMRTLLSKFREVEFTPFVKNAIRPVEAEIMIIGNDLKRATPFIVRKPEQYMARVEHAQMSIIDIERLISRDKSLPVENLYNQIHYLKNQINDVLNTNGVQGEGIIHLKSALSNIDDAIKKMEIFISQLATANE